MRPAENQGEPETINVDELVATKPSQSLGSWTDNLLGDKRMRRKAMLKTEALLRAMADGHPLQ
jgi:hypothetical protein